MRLYKEEECCCNCGNSKCDRKMNYFKLVEFVKNFSEFKITPTQADINMVIHQVKAIELLQQIGEA